MEKTANYGLPKWEKSDFIKMDDVNAAFGKIDETLKANADAAGGLFMEPTRWRPRRRRRP